MPDNNLGHLHRRRGVAAALGAYDAIDDCHTDAGQVAELNAFKNGLARRVLRLVHQHEVRRTFEVINLKPEHPVMKGFPASWTDNEDELYEIKKLWPDCVPLAKGIGVKKAEHPCVWVNTYGKARAFGTTLGHSNETMGSPVYLDLVTRGLLWACGKLDENGKPKAGYGVK